MWLKAVEHRTRQNEGSRNRDSQDVTKHKLTKDNNIISHIQNMKSGLPFQEDRSGPNHAVRNVTKRGGTVEPSGTEVPPGSLDHAATATGEGCSSHEAITKRP